MQLFQNSLQILMTHLFFFKIAFYSTFTLHFFTRPLLEKERKRERERERKRERERELERERERGEKESFRIMVKK